MAALYCALVDVPLVYLHQPNMLSTTNFFNTITKFTRLKNIMIFWNRYWLVFNISKKRVRSASSVIIYGISQSNIYVNQEVNDTCFFFQSILKLTSWMDANNTEEIRILIRFERQNLRTEGSRCLLINMQICQNKIVYVLTNEAVCYKGVANRFFSRQIHFFPMIIIIIKTRNIFVASLLVEIPTILTPTTNKIWTFTRWPD